MQIVNPERTYLISDLHLGHKNIIGYCHRPFVDIREMNEALIRNWNAVVRPEDTVYFLGDFCFGNPYRWLNRLAGHIIFIRGSHDNRLPRSLTSDHIVINTDGLSFYLVHKAFDAPSEWTGWVIHGHWHNERPFTDVVSKRVNVCVEAVDYKPVSLALVVQHIRGLIKLSEVRCIEGLSSKGYKGL